MNELTTQGGVALVPAADELGGETQLIARNADEMRIAQANLVTFFTRKAELARQEANDADNNACMAAQHRIKSGSFERLAKKLEQRAVYYEKARDAVKAGGIIVPNMPMDAFAVRVKTGRTGPKHISTTSSWRAAEVTTDYLPAGEGKYVDDRSLVNTWEERKKRADGSEYTQEHYTPADFDEVDFPLVAAKPVILADCTAAMRELIYDEIGVASVRAKGDPIVMGRIYDKSNRSRMMTFLISWYVDLRDL